MRARLISVFGKSIDRYLSRISGSLIFSVILSISGKPAMEQRFKSVDA